MAYKIESAQWTIPVTGLQSDPLADLEQWENELWSKPTEARKKLNKKAKDRRYYSKHKHELIKKHTEYNRTHKEQRRETCKKYYDDNKEKESARQKKYLSDNPEKYAAHLAVQRAIRAGRLVKKPCENCGVENAEAHHDDYSDQLGVKWLCHKCHMALHSQERSNVWER